MRTSDVLQHFGDSHEAAKAIGITRQAVEQWGEAVPEGTAYKIQVLTGGRLQVDQSLYQRKERSI
jgi:hypothetical protein